MLRSLGDGDTPGTGSVWNLTKAVSTPTVRLWARDATGDTEPTAARPNALATCMGLHGPNGWLSPYTGAPPAAMIRSVTFVPHSMNRAGPDGAGQRTRSAIAASSVRAVSVFEEAPELLRGLGPRAAAQLAPLRVPLMVVERGPWAPPRLREGPGRHFGLLVLDGLVLRRVTLDGRTGAELLGNGDLLQPWVLQPPYDTLAVEPGWEVLEQARLAVLDDRFAARVAPTPEVAAALVGRAIERARMLAFQHVASHIPGLESRLLALFWALADRWGRVTPEGVLIPIRLTHATLAELVGASRPSVSTALAQLGRQDLLRRQTGGWLLDRRAPRGQSRPAAPAERNGHPDKAPVGTGSARIAM
jgi:CRP/FNR family cyclic AMP-dependent transcriptional regulator